ncbi:MAG TPA: hypothetical protein VMW35_14765 [Myxococcota bacterium]|jgi:hypothetical protein|nr:hypothetical protein [Myxococcota bacterium]
MPLAAPTSMRLPAPRLRSGLFGALVLAALCAGCAPAPGQTPRAPGAAGESYFPMIDGARWVYEVHAGFQKSRLEVTARGVLEVSGSPTPLWIVQEQSAGAPYGLDEDGLAGYLVRDGYVARLSFLSEDADGHVRLVSSDPTWVIPVDPRPGQRWEQTTHVFTSPESRGGEQHWQAEVEQVGAVRVPAGTFDDVLLVRTRYLDPTVSSSPLLTYEDYYARGVGLVRSVSHNHQAWFWMRTVDQELVAAQLETPVTEGR